MTRHCWTIVALGATAVLTSSAPAEADQTEAVVEELRAAETRYRERRAVVRRLGQLALEQGDLGRLERLDIVEYRIEALHTRAMTTGRERLGPERFLEVVRDLEQGRFSARRLEEKLGQQQRRQQIREEGGSEWFPVHQYLPSAPRSTPEGTPTPLGGGGGGGDGSGLGPADKPTPTSDDPGVKRPERERPERPSRPMGEDDDLKKKKGRRGKP
jgi:hypothetical protein